MTLIQGQGWASGELQVRKTLQRASLPEEVRPPTPALYEVVAAQTHLMISIQQTVGVIGELKARPTLRCASSPGQWLRSDASRDSFTRYGRGNWQSKRANCYTAIQDTRAIWLPHPPTTERLTQLKHRLRVKGRANGKLHVQPSLLRFSSPEQVGPPFPPPPKSRVRSNTF